MKFKKISIIVLSAVCLLNLAACSSKKDSASGSSSPGNQTKPVEIRMSWWGGQARHDMMNKLIDKFQEKYPNITVVREFTTEVQYPEKLTTQSAGGNAPDVIQTSSFYLDDFVSRNMLMDLGALTSSGDINVNGFDPVDVGGGKVKDKLYAISLGHNVTGLIHNAEMFKKAGIETGNNWTWDDYFKNAQKLKTVLGPDAWATEDEGGQYRGFELFAQQRGKSVFKDKGLGIDKQDLVDWFKFWDSMRKAGVVPPPALQSEQGDKPQEQSMLARGKVAMISKSSNQLKIYQKSSKDELSITAYPMNPKGQKKIPLIVASLGISANSKHPKEAAALINFIVNEPDAANIFRGEHGPQASTKMQAVIEPTLSLPEKKEVAYVKEMMPSTKPYPSMPGANTSVQKLLLAENEAVAFGRKSIEQSVNDFFTQANQILQR